MLGAAAVAGGCALLAMAVAGSRAGGGEGSSLWALVAVVGGLGVVLGCDRGRPVGGGGPRAGRRVAPTRSCRLASRSLARNRVRSSAVIGAICAVAIVVVAGTTLYESSGDDPGTTPACPTWRAIRW